MKRLSEPRWKKYAKGFLLIVFGAIVSLVVGPYFVRMLPGPQVNATVTEHVPTGPPYPACRSYEVSIFPPSNGAVDFISATVQFQGEIQSHEITAVEFRAAPHLEIAPGSVTTFDFDGNGGCEVAGTGAPLPPNVQVSMGGSPSVKLFVQATNFQEPIVGNFMESNSPTDHLPLDATGFYTYQKLNLTVTKQLRFAITTVSPSLSDRATLFYDDASAQAKWRRYDLAIRRFSQAIQLEPDYSEAFVGRGQAYEAKSNHAAAIQDYDQALRLKPDYPEALLDRGLAYALQRKYDEATVDYDKALLLNPDYPEALFSRGSVRMDERDYVEAIQDFNKAIHLRPGYPRAICSLGDAYRNSHDLLLAKTTYNLARSIGIDCP